MSDELIDQVNAAYAGGEFQHAQQAASIISDDLVRKIAFCGTPAQAREKLDWVEEVGPTGVSIFPLGDDRRGTIARFAALAVREREDREGTLCERLRNDCVGLWEGLHAHPFIEGPTAGTLPPENFRFYVEQNLQYLPSTRGRWLWRPAVPATSRRCGSSPPTSRTSSRSRSRRTASCCAGSSSSAPSDLGGSVGDGAGERHLHAASSSRPQPPRGRSRSWPRSSPAPGATGTSPPGDREQIVEHPVYAEWIRFFASPDYADLVDRMQADFERLVARDERAIERLSFLFTTGVRLERGFWDMAYGLEHWPDLQRNRLGGFEGAPLVVGGEQRGPTASARFVKPS